MKAVMELQYSVRCDCLGLQYICAQVGVTLHRFLSRDFCRADAEHPCAFVSDGRGIWMGVYAWLESA